MSSGSAAKRTRVEYRLDGIQREVDAVDCNDVAFERGAPVRSLPGWRLKRHHDGNHWMGALGVSIGFESLTDRAASSSWTARPSSSSQASRCGFGGPRPGAYVRTIRTTSFVATAGRPY